MLTKFKEKFDSLCHNALETGRQIGRKVRDKANALFGSGPGAGAGLTGGAAAGGGALAISEPTAHAGGITLPDLGVDVGGTVETAASDLGSIFMKIIAIGIVICVGWIAWSWRKKIRG